VLQRETFSILLPRKDDGYRSISGEIESYVNNVSDRKTPLL
jgi:hypothetical protein